MKVIDVYERYFEAFCVYNGRERHAVSVKLTAMSDSGHISYEASVSFFPHDSEEDFAVSFDAFASEIVYEGKGRRSKKREAELLEGLDGRFESLAASLGGKIYYEKPLIEARRA